LRLVFSQVKEVYDMDGIRTNITGREVNVKIWIHIITGDNSRHNDLCAHMNVGKALFPVRSYRCFADELDGPDLNCNFSL